MATLGELRATILDDLIDSRLTTPQVNRAINDAINFYEKKSFYFNGFNKSVTLIGGQEYYTSSDIPDYVSIEYIEFTTGGLRIKVMPVDDSYIAALQNGGVTGTPYAFSYIHQQLRFFPIPSSGIMATVQAAVKFPPLADDSSSNVWTTEAEELIRQSAKRRLALNILHNVELAQSVMPLEQEAYDALLAESRRRYPVRVLTSPGDLSLMSGYETWGVDSWQ
jgi:hypothetical protein